MIKQLLKNEFVYLDGAMGTVLQRSGLKLGQKPEILNFTDSELIKSIHEQYFKAGSNIICANTFGANSHKLQGSGYTVTQVVEKAVQNAKSVANKYGGYVALDIGPIGLLLEPSGTLSFEHAYKIFKEIVVAGKNAGADLVLLETMTDLYEIKAGILAVKENCDLPIFATMTFEENARTFTGCGIENMAMTLQGLGVDAIGFNCSLGPKELLPLVKRLSKCTSLPIIAKPNAGLPDPFTGEYNLTAREFGKIMKSFALAGVQIMGGCCGSDFDFISELVKNVKDVKRGKSKYKSKTWFCSSTDVVNVDTIRVIGERINPTGKKRFASALVNKEMDYILAQAVEQEDAGAEILDINVGVPQTDEKQLMIDVVKAVQSVVKTPLCIDSSNLDAIEAGLRVYNGKPILNSVNGEDDKLEKILPLAKKYGASVIALTIDGDGVPKTVEKRVQIAKKIIDKAKEYGIEKQDIIVDCLTLTISAQQDDCFKTLKAMKKIKKQLGVELVLGVSNISFGLPNRELVNHSFLSQALASGLTLAIVNPNIASNMDAVFAYRALSGYDASCEQFIQRFSGQTLNNIVQNDANLDMTIDEAIIKGLSDRVKNITKQLLKTHAPLEIVNKMLIPALDIVGKMYEQGKIFLPQLIRSASSASCGFDEIKTQILNNSQPSISKGKIILASVKGDVHDIGKNIVKVILENYGYEIIDLGKDVEPSIIVQSAIENDVKLIGLSALMTTTVESMRITIEQLRLSGHNCTIMVGGAVLTSEYAQNIGADYYAKDAKQAVDIAKKVL